MILQPLVPYWVIIACGSCFLVACILSVIRTKGSGLRSHAYWRGVAMGIVLILIALGPSYPGGRSPAGMLNVDVVIAIVRTTSMSALDYSDQQPRIEGARTDLMKLIHKINGAHIAIVTFDSSARVSVPLTTDASAVMTAVKVLDLENSNYSTGTSIDKPIDVVKRLLEKSGESHPDRGRLFFYIGDGEQTSSNVPRSFAELRPMIDGGAVLGYGTEAGAYMTTYYGIRNVKIAESFKYVPDYSEIATKPGGRAVSKVDERNLRTIAESLGLKYFHRTNQNEPIDAIVSESRLEVVVDTHREVLFYLSTYWMLSIVMTLLLVWWFMEILPTIHLGMKGVE